MTKPYARVGVITFLIGVSLLTARFLVPKVLWYFTQATRPQTYSLANSYVFASPAAVPADGLSKIRINVFLLSQKGLGVANKTIDLQVTPKTAPSGPLPQIQAIQPTTDKFGQAVFELVSTTPGQFSVKALVDGLEFPKTTTVIFK